MARWIMEWFTVSIVGLLGFGMIVVFSTFWSLIPSQIAESSLGTLDAEGKAAFILLFIIAIGCVKLFSRPHKV